MRGVNLIPIRQMLLITSKFLGWVSHQQAMGVSEIETANQYRSHNDAESS